MPFSSPSAVRRAGLGLVAALLALFSPPPAFSAPPGGAVAGRVYATATVNERPLDSATAAVTVVSRQDIEATAADSALDALSGVPGLAILGGGSRGGFAVQLRGGDPNFTRVLIDGVPVNDGTYQQGEVFDFAALPALAIERIEVVRGPLSAIYGSTGLAGAIQVFTRSGEGHWRGELRLAGGDAEAYRAGAGWGGGGERADLFLAVAAEGEKERVAAERYWLSQLQGRSRLRLGDSAELVLAGRFAGWDGDDYGEGSGGPDYGSGELRRSDHEEAGASARLALTGAVAQRFELAFYRHRLERASPAIFPLVPESREDTRFTRLRLGWTASRAFGEGLQLSVGGDLEREEGVNSSVLLLPPFLGGELPGDYRLERQTGGVYGELALQRGAWSAELGLRGDRPEGAASQLSPRLGLSCRPGAGATRLHASLGRAFKLPSFFALASPPALGGNRDLEPEKSSGGDLGVQHSWAGGELEADLTFFTQRFENLVDFDFASFRHVNRAWVQSRGAELSLAWRPRPGFSAALVITTQQVRGAAGEPPPRHRPRRVGNLRLFWQPRARLGLAFEVGYTGPSFDQQIPVSERDRVAGRTLLAAAATWRLSERWRLFARVDNLTDERYETLIGFPGAGRGGRLGLVFTPGGG